MADTPITNPPGGPLFNKSLKGQTWLITGASSGFGRLMTELVLRLDGNVVAASRSAKKMLELEFNYPGQLQLADLDITDTGAINQKMNDALSRFGHIDVLVNNAGYGVTGAIEEVTPNEYMPMFQTNFFGLLNVTTALLPQFRDRRAGTIVNISSIGGLIGSAGWGFYNATKFAVEGLSQALRAEVEPLGIKVLVVEPGPFRTEFLGDSGQTAKENIPDYRATAGMAREYFETQNGKQAGDPQKAVEMIVAAVESGNPPQNLLLGRSAWERWDRRLTAMRDEMESQKQMAFDADYGENRI